MSGLDRSFIISVNFYVENKVIYYIDMLKSLNKNFNIKIQNIHSKLVTELFTAAIYVKV